MIPRTDSVFSTKLQRDSSYNMYFGISCLTDCRYKGNVEKQKETKNISKIITKLLVGKIVRKYRCCRMSEETLGFSHKLFKLKPAPDLNYVRLSTVAQGYAATLKKSVYEYLTRDDISRLLVRKNETII